VPDMRTRALRVYVHAYDDQSWSVAVVSEVWAYSAPVSAEMVSSTWGTLATVKARMGDAMDYVIRLERERLAGEAVPA
jgi:hypothetical protein